MPQQERPDEARAAAVVAGALGVELSFADLTGGVDYVAEDGTLVLEVTRFTDQALRADMRKAANAEHVLALGTGHSWWVTFDGHPRYDGIGGRLLRPLMDLETHHLLEWNRVGMGWWTERVPTLAEAVRIFYKENVSNARTIPDETPGRLFLSAGGGWVYGGPDSALSILETAIAADGKHLLKLGAAATPQRHLWIWTDHATPDEYRRAMAEDRLPGRPPDLPAEVTQLWAVDEGYGLGWRWDGAAWSSVVL